MRWETDGGPVSVAGKNPPDLPPRAKGMIMKAALYHSFGGPEVLEVVEVPEPKMFADQVRIRVKASALNPADLGFQAGAVDALVDSFFPVIPGINKLTILAENGEASARAVQICARRWRQARKRVFVSRPSVGSDHNDILMKRVS